MRVLAAVPVVEAEATPEAAADDVTQAAPVEPEVTQETQDVAPTEGSDVIAAGALTDAPVVPTQENEADVTQNSDVAEPTQALDAGVAVTSSDVTQAEVAEAVTSEAQSDVASSAAPASDVTEGSDAVVVETGTVHIHVCGNCMKKIVFNKRLFLQMLGE